MGSPYLSSNESIILSTNNVIINTVPAEAILTNERLMLIDTRHAELRPQDIPFHAIETVTTGENSDLDPMLSLSLVTGPGVTLSMGIIFPQQPKMKRVAERDEWAARIRELSSLSAREGGKIAMEILPPWVPGPVPDEGKDGTGPASSLSEAESKYRNPPLTPRKTIETPPSANRTVTALGVIAVIVIALIAGAYLYAPALLGIRETPLPPVTPVSTTAPTTTPTLVPTTVATPERTPEVTVLATTAPAAAPELLIPASGVWVRVTYEGSFSGTAGAPGRFREISDTGNHLYQLSVRDEIVSAAIQKGDNTGRKLTVEIFDEGTLVRSGSVTAPKGSVNINADLRTS
ncbi:MAG TPA: hypothetical protein VLL74_03180 [Methanoregula sp.]|nr:hypothetical protein [Methanoregula sp.]